MNGSRSKIEFPFQDKNLSLYLRCKDHSVSRETFDLYRDRDTGLLITLPQPEPEDLPNYYESESYISHTDSKKNWFDKVYQLVKSYSTNRKLRLINSLQSSKGNLLDLGCGTGDFLKACKQDGWKVFGVEPNEKARNRAQSKTQKRLIFDSIESLSKTHGLVQFDIISLWHVLEHVQDLTGYIRQMDELLAEKGYLIVAVPNYESYDAAYYKEYWAAYDVPRHLWHFSQNSIHELFEPYGFRVLDTHPLYFDSYYVSLLSEKYKNGQNRIVNAFYRGTLSNWKARRSGQYSSLIYILKRN